MEATTEQNTLNDTLTLATWSTLDQPLNCVLL